MVFYHCYLYIISIIKLSSTLFCDILINMKESLKNIKEKLELAIENPTKKDMFIGQAMGLIDSLVEKINNSGENTNLPIPDMIWQHTDKPSKDTMLDAVQRHKDIHTELSKDSISNQNTQFEQLK